MLTNKGFSSAIKESHEKKVKLPFHTRTVQYVRFRHYTVYVHNRHI
jgi:hypothetical protein